MPLELRFTCALDHGLHARPASVMAAAVQSMDSRVTLTRQASGGSADVRSVLSIVALDVAKRDECIIRAEGPDAEAAISALRELVSEGLAHIEATALEQDAAGAIAQARIPAGLQRLGVRSITGRGICPGFGHATAVVIRSLHMPHIDPPSRGKHRERAAAHQAIEQVRNDLALRFDKGVDGLERDLVRAHMGIAADPALRQQIEDHINAGISAITAVGRAAEHFMRMLRAAESAYVRDRAVDVEDVCQQILEHLGVGESTTFIELRQPSIIIADLLTPRQMMQMDRSRVRGLVLGRVGATSHTAILARAFGIPTVVDVQDVHAVFADGLEVIVDASGGFVLPEVNEQVRRYYAIGRRAAKRRRERLAPHVTAPALTSDGVRLEIAANVSTAEEVNGAMNDGAEGIGLFRTEMLFLDRTAPPDEEEQFTAYSRAVHDAVGRSVIFRTFDIGGDKPAPYLRLPHEENPFLGWRGIRLYEKSPQILRSQLRAILRASAIGPVKIMAPMVTNSREAKWFVERVREVQEDLRKESMEFDDRTLLGVMIEVPAAALAIDQLAEIVDFFSIGTNDLAQYFMAVDRGNPRVASLCDPLEPAFVRLLKLIADAARRNKKWIGVCGEMAGDLRNLPIMVGMGVDEISVSSANGGVLELKAALAGLECSTCINLLNRIVASSSADEVRALLNETSAAAGTTPIIDADLVLIDSDAATKIEAIRELVGLIVASGRSSDSHGLENAVWAREDTYSTGLGFGIAIPHCKSDAVRMPTIAILKLERPIDWGSTDGEPVRVAMMLAIPAGGTGSGAEDDVSKQAARMHMQVLAKLSRKLMHEGFRERLMHSATPEAVVTAIQTSLED